MTANEAMLPTVKATVRHPLADRFDLSALFYQQVKSDFLRESARHLHESSTYAAPHRQPWTKC